MGRADNVDGRFGNELEGNVTVSIGQQNHGGIVWKTKTILIISVLGMTNSRNERFFMKITHENHTE